MPTIQVITDTGTAQGNAIFSGTFGQKNAETGKFEFDQTLRGIYLLDLLSGPHAQQDTCGPLTEPTLKTLEVSDDAIDGLRANLISSLGQRWDEMYSNALLHQSGMARTAVQAEMGMVAKAVSNAMEKLGFKDVMPCHCDAKTSFTNVRLRPQYEDYGPLCGYASDMLGHLNLVHLSNATEEAITPLDTVTTSRAPFGMNYMQGEASLRLLCYAKEGTAHEIVQALISLPANTTNTVVGGYFIGQPTWTAEPHVPVSEEVQGTVDVAATFLSSVQPSGQEPDDLENQAPSA